MKIVTWRYWNIKIERKKNAEKGEDGLGRLARFTTGEGGPSEKFPLH